MRNLIWFFSSLRNGCKRAPRRKLFWRRFHLVFIGWRIGWRFLRMIKKRMLFLFVRVAVVGIASFGLVSSAIADRALATGTFWQLGKTRLESWSDEQLAAEVAVVKEAGMDTIL